MDKKQQILYIHGGGTFKSREDFAKTMQEKFTVSLDKKAKWSDEYFDQELEGDFQIIKPRMPLKEDARYSEWKVYFEKYFPLLQDDIVLIGYSLGAFFLVKYLSEKNFPHIIDKLILVAPPYDNSLPGEDLVGGFELGSDLNNLVKQCANTYFLFSNDDPVVPMSHAKKYQEVLPEAKYYFFDDKQGHFRVPEFAELIEIVKNK